MASRRASLAASGFPPGGSTTGGLAGAKGGGGGGGGLKEGGRGGTKSGDVGRGEMTSVWTFLSSSTFLSCSNSFDATDLVFLSLAEVLEALIAERSAERSFSGSLYDGFLTVQLVGKSDTFLRRSMPSPD